MRQGKHEIKTNKKLKMSEFDTLNIYSVTVTVIVVQATIKQLDSKGRMMLSFKYLVDLIEHNQCLQPRNMLQSKVCK